MRSEFTTVRLGDLCEIIMGQSPKSEFYNTDGMGLPFLQGNRTFGDKYPTFDTYTTSVTKVAEASDVIMSVRAPVGDVNITPVKLCLGRGVCALRHKNGAQEFLYYLMRYYSNELINRESGTVFGSVNRDDIFNLEVSVPPLKEQLVIGHVLSTIDDKIAINNAINQHLEQIAQAIFKSWFVDFEPFRDSGFIGSELGDIPAGWRALPIEAIAEKVAMGPFGSNIKVETFVETGVPIISGNHLRGLYLEELGYNFITEEHARKLSNSLVHAGDIIFTHAGNIGQVALIPEECDYPYYVISQRQFYLRCDKQKAVPEYINFYFHTREGQGKLLANASQTGVPSIARPASHLKSIVVPIPPIEIQMKWLDTVRPLMQLFNCNLKENSRLATLRDTLLPRLMSGELSVADLKAIT